MLSFYEQLMRKQTEGLGERQLLNKLYDGHSSWTMTSAGKRSGSGEKREEFIFLGLH